MTALAEAQAKKPVITERPADLLQPEWQQLRDRALELKGCNGTDEDVLTYAMFPQVAPKFFGTRDQGPKNLGRTTVVTVPDDAPPAPVPGTGPVRERIEYQVTIDGVSRKVSVAPA